MRLSLYAPLLGLCVLAAPAQTPPRGHLVTTEQTTTGDWMRGPLPVAQPHLPARLTCELCTTAAPPVKEQGGTNPAAVKRAIRALGSRIFPGRKLAAGLQPQANRFLQFFGKRREQ